MTFIEAVDDGCAERRLNVEISHFPTPEPPKVGELVEPVEVGEPPGFEEPDEPVEVEQSRAPSSTKMPP